MPRVVDAVFLTTGHTQLDLEQHVDARHAREIRAASLEVLVQRVLGEIEHVRAEQRLFVRGVERLARIEQAVDPRQQVTRAVIGVQDDRHAIGFGQRSHVERARDAAFDRSKVCLVVDELAGVELTAAVRVLDDHGRAGTFGRFHHGIGRVAADDVDCGQRALRFLAIREQLLECLACNDARFEFELAHEQSIAVKSRMGAVSPRKCLSGLADSRLENRPSRRATCMLDGRSC